MCDIINAIRDGRTEAALAIAMDAVQADGDPTHMRECGCEPPRIFCLVHSPPLQSATFGCPPAVFLTKTQAEQLLSRAPGWLTPWRDESAG